MNVSYIFGYPALPAHHAEDESHWPILPATILDPKVLRGSAEILTKTESELNVYLVVTVFLCFFVEATYSKIKSTGTSLRISSNSKFFKRFLYLTIGSFVILPITATLAGVVALYRFLVHIYLKRSIGDKYVSLLKGPDVLWAMTTDQARSAVNVLVIVEVIPHEHNNDFMTFVRKVASNSLLTEVNNFPKLLYRRAESKLGYFYWKQSNGHLVDDYVRKIESAEASEEISEDDLQDIVAEHCNSPFPFGDTATWEILVGTKLQASSQSLELYPLIFRVHHSVGDGVALLRLLLEGLADRMASESLTAKEKKSAWANSSKSEPKESQGKSKNYNMDSQLTQSFSNEECGDDSSLKRDDPEVSVNVSERISCYCAQPVILNQTEKSNGQMTKKSTLSRLRNSFRLLRHGVDKNVLPRVQASIAWPQLSTPSKTYSPIKGLGNVEAMKGVSGRPISLLTTNVSWSRDRNKPKSSCVVLPIPRVENANSPIRTGSAAKSQVLKDENLEKIYIGENIDEKCIKQSIPLCDFAKCEIGKESESEKKMLAQSEKIQQCAISPLVHRSLRARLHIGSNNFASIKEITMDIVVTFLACAACITNSIFEIIRHSVTLIQKLDEFALKIPNILFSQRFGKTEDELLFGRTLSGQKVISWVTEQTSGESDDQLQTKIRQIREKLGGIFKFSDILMVCVSRSLERYYRQAGGPIPSFVKVVLPARVDYSDLGKGLITTALYKTPYMTAKVTRLYNSRRIIKKPLKWQNVSFNNSTESDSEEKIQTRAANLHAAINSPSNILHKAELDNKFTVAILNLPIDATPSGRIIANGLSKELNFIQSVQEQCRKLKNGPDYLLNYWLLRWVAHLFPSFLVRPFLSGGPCSLVLSNLPGPEDPVHLSGRRIRDIVFWVPNRGMNGLGIGMLSYCGRFSMGIIADKALITKKEDAKQIITAIFEEVDKLYKCVCLPSYQK